MPTIIAIAVAVAIIGLQIYLSKTASKIGGLILPVIAFFISVLVVWNISVPSYGWKPACVAFFLANIPTLILLAIYFVFRKKHA